MDEDRNAPDLLRVALQRYRDALRHDRDNREAAQDDLKFLAGEQWDPVVERRRIAEGRPCLTINRLPQFVRQVTGDLRLNKPAITVRPVDGGADTKLADTLSGLIRNIESVSDADTAYIQAAEHSISCGMGHFRVSTQYLSEDAWEQEIRIEPVANPFAVVWDHAATKLTREDARFCFVLARVDRDSFRAMFPDAGTANMDQPVSTDWSDWVSRDSILIAEYWVKKPITRTLARLPDGAVLDMSDAGPEIIAQAVSEGAQLRRAEGHKVCSYLITANEILAGPFDWPGRYIPIIPVIGSEIAIGDRIVRHGLVRFAKDPQRSYNYHTSADVEFAALQPKAPFLATVEQIKGLEEEWARANQDNHSVLVYNPDPQAGGPPQRVQPPLPSAAMGALAARASEDMKAVTGIYDAALGARSNETSGRAILARQREGDVGSFHYIDNLSKAIAHCGRILVDLIPKIYDSERAIRVLGEDGGVDIVPINVQLPDGTLRNDLAAGRYDVTVRSGPSFSSRRDEAAQAMMEFMRVYPPAAGAIGDLVADAMDWPGSKEIAARLKAMMPPGLAEKAKAEARGEPPPQMEPPPPGPEQIEAQAKAEKAQADAVKAQAEAQKAMMEAQAMQMGAMPLPGMPAPAQAPSSPVSINLDRDMQDALGASQNASAAAMQDVAASVGEAAMAIAQAAQMMAATQSQVGQMVGSVAEAARVIGAPKRVVRDEQGRAIGVEAAI